MDMWHLDNLTTALAGGGTPRGHVGDAVALLMPQLRAVIILVSGGAGVWREKKTEKDA